MIETLESKILIKDLGLRSYQEVWSLQKKMQQQRINERIEDTVILVEHEPVYTLGNTGVTVYPDTVTTGVKADYLKKPIRPKWGYVLQGTVPYYDPTVFDPATDSYDTAAKSYNFELHPLLIIISFPALATGISG